MQDGHAGLNTAGLDNSVADVLYKSWAKEPIGL